MSDTSPYQLYFGKLEHGEYGNLYGPTCNVCAFEITHNWGDDRERHILFHESLRPWAMTEEAIKAEIARRVLDGRLPANNPYTRQEKD